VRNVGAGNSVAMPDHVLIAKGLPGALSSSGGDIVNGQWSSLEGKYQLSLNGEDLAGTIEKERLTAKRSPLDLVFSKEE